jgi:prophage antirepressor-like protein
VTITTLPAQFEQIPIDILIIGNERWARGSQVGSALGYSHAGVSMRRLYNRNAKEFGTDDTMVIELPTAGGPQLTRLYSAKGIAKIAMLADTPKAAAFRDWAAKVLTTQPVAAQPALPAPAMSATALRDIRQLWLKQGQNRRFLRYQKAGLKIPEILLLCGWKNKSTVTSKRRTAEALGLLQPPPYLETRRLQAARFGRLGQRT